MAQRKALLGRRASQLPGHSAVGEHVHQIAKQALTAAHAFYLQRTAEGRCAAQDLCVNAASSRGAARLGQMTAPLARSQRLPAAHCTAQAGSSPLCNPAPR